jgi:crotonobetainyl-CoA:carnitine CoA-transferase CaiB-like acyl-CoA transferase
MAGRGQHIDVSKQEALLSLMRVFAAYYPNQKRVVDRFSGLFQHPAFIQSFANTHCKYGEAIMVAAFPHQLASLAEFMEGGPKEAESEASEDPFAPYVRAFRMISQWMPNHTKEEIYHQGQTARVPAAPIRNPKEVVDSEQFKARGFFRETEHSEMGKVRIPAAPYQFSRTPWEVRCPAPLLGQHNEDIYCHRLGLSKQDLVKLREAGVI